MSTDSILSKTGKPRPRQEFTGGTLRGWPVFLIALTAFLVVVPFFFFGIPSGHDLEFHLNSWMEVVDQCRQGILYPRWAALAHYGYGEARFLFYPPASWLLGGLLGTLLPWRIVPGFYVWLALTLSGCSMFMFARRWLDRRDTIFAAAAYAANPYYIVVVYWRSAYAELLAGALLPLLLLCVFELDRGDRKTIFGLSLLVAAAALTNVPAFIMVSYSLAALAVAFAMQRRSARVLPHVTIAFVIGVALAAFYLFPAVYEQKWINIAQAFSPGVRPQDNFLFTTTADPDHNTFNRLISLLASSQLIVLTIATFFAWRSRDRQNGPMLATLTLLAALLMCSFTSLFWSHLPALRFVQLPWRWLLCMNVALVLLVTISSKSWIWRGTALLLMFGVVGWVSVRIQPPWWDDYRDIADMLAAHETAAGYEGVDEYVPLGADAYNTKADAPLVSLNNGETLDVKVNRWDAERKSFTAQTGHADLLVLRLFNYPAWRVEVGGQKVQTQTREQTGQMLIPVAAGANQVRVTFIRTWDRTVGTIFSLITAAGLLLWSFAYRTHAT